MVTCHKNSPMIFRNCMSNVLGKYLGKRFKVYLDDIIINSESIDEHANLVRNVFEEPRRYKKEVMGKRAVG